MRPTETIILQDYTLDVLLLPRNSDIVVKHLLTVESIAPEGSSQISISASTNTTIKAGASLSFVAPDSPTERYQVLFKETTEITTSPTTAIVSNLKKTVPIDSTAEAVQGMLPLFGIQSFDLQSQETTVDTTNTQSGSGTESAMVRYNRTIPVNGTELAGDLALVDIIKKVVFDSAFNNRKIYAIATYPDGERFEGPAKVMGFTSPGNQNEVKRYQFTLQFQGQPIWTPAYYAPSAP